MAASTKMTVLYDVAPCGLIKTDRDYSFHQRDEALHGAATQKTVTP
jgi:hypothetical protein